MKSKPENRFLIDICDKAEKKRTPENRFLADICDEAKKTSKKKDEQKKALKKPYKWIKKNGNGSSRRKWKNHVPKVLRLALGRCSGFFFGKEEGGSWYVGKPDTQDGHILITGESGSGKTRSIVIPSMGTWKGIQVIIDVKGNLLGYWERLNSHTGKKILVFNPDSPGSCRYDPFLFLRHGGEKNLAGNARDLALAMVPLLPSVRDPIWIQAAQNFLTGALIYYYELGTNFCDAMVAINVTSNEDIIDKVMTNGSTSAKTYVSKLSDVDEKVIANIGMELSNLASFTADPIVLEAFSADEEHEILDWQEIFTAQDATDVILVIPEARLEQWQPMVQLMVNQLIKSLEQRKERTYHPESELPPVLVLLDEFARLGKISAIKNGLATLRSRGVTFALFIQSLADLDITYGHEGAKSIIGNCPYKAVLGVTDAECQEYFSRLGGTFDSVQKSCSMNYDCYNDEAAGYSKTLSETRKPVIFPEEFLTMEDVVLFNPYGTCRVNKSEFYETEEMCFIWNEEEEYGDEYECNESFCME